MTTAPFAAVARTAGHTVRRAPVASAAVLVLIAGAVTGLVLPRGPVTTTQAVSALGSCLLVGALAGRVAGSRWSILLAPVAFLVGYEVARLPAEGPTVDGVHLGSIYGVLVLLSGRGVDAVVMLFPLAVGAMWGAAAGRERSREGGHAAGSARRWVRWVGATMASAAVMALAVLLLRPASTAPFTAADGTTRPGSIAELTTVGIGGHEQSIMLRGQDRDAPVLLFLEGGPGGSALGAMRASGAGLEEDFVVATWDQRGTGKSISALEPTGTLTVAQMIRDTIAVTDHLRTRFGQEKIYLVGSSWGSTLAVLTAQQAPERFHAVVGTGQMVDQQETDRRMYAESLEWAERTGRTDFAERLRENGPPPYDDVLAYPDALSTNTEYQDFTHGPDHDPKGAYPRSFFVPEYTLIEQLRGMGAILDTFAVLYPQLQDIDFRQDVPTLAVPMFVVLGRHESPGRADLAREWFGELDAPSKRLVEFDLSGHTPHLDEPGRFHDFMVETVVPASR